MGTLKRVLVHARHVLGCASGLLAIQGGGEVTLNRAHMENCKHVSTPMSVQDKLSVQIGTTLSADDAFAYRSTVCGLQYLTLTRPDLSFAMNKVCQFLGKLSSGFFGM